LQSTITNADGHELMTLYTTVKSYQQHIGLY